MEISKESVVNLEGNNEFVRVYAKQYDKESRRLILEFTHNGELWEIPSRTVARFAMTKPDGEQILNDAVVSENTVEVELTYQMLSAAGNARCEVQLYDNGAKEMLSSAVFDLVVSRAAYSKDKVESSSEYQSFIHALLEVDVKLGEVEQATDDANKAARMASTAADTANAAAKSANTAASSANNAASAANTAAGTAQTQGNYAKTQGNYAKAQGDRAKSEADRLEGVDVAALQEQLDALPGKYVQLTNLTKLTKEGLRMEDFSPGNYFALGEVANSLEDKPEGVQLAQAFVTMYWDYGTTGNTTKRIELLERVNGRKWFKSYNGTTWGSWFEYARKTDVEPYTKLKEYTTWTDLGLEATATVEEIIEAMGNNSIAILDIYAQNSKKQYPAQYGLLTISKVRDDKVKLVFNTSTINTATTYIANYHKSSYGFSGWKELSFEGHNHNGFEPIDVTGKTLDIQSLTSQTPGIEWYRCRTSAGAANITNIPVAGQPFFLEKKVIRVGSANGTDLVINFRFLSSSAKKEYECWCTVSSTGAATWTEWKEQDSGMETGSWTPVLFGTTTAGNPTYVSRDGSYMKIGKMVVVYADVTVSSFGNAAGGVRIKGLPFPVAQYATGAVGRVIGTVSGVYVTTPVLTPGEEIYFYQKDPSKSDSTALEVTQFNESLANCGFSRMTIVYWTE